MTAGSFDGVPGGEGVAYPLRIGEVCRYGARCLSGAHPQAPAVDPLKVFSGLDGLHRLEPAWRAMLGEGRCYLHSPEYYRCYLEHLASGPRVPRFVALGAADEPALVVPLEERTLRKGPMTLRLLQTPVHPHLNQFDVPGCGFDVPGCEVLQMMTEPLAALLRPHPALPRWDAMRLVNVPDASPVALLLPRLARERLSIRGERQRAWFACREEADFEAQYSGRFRRNLGRLRRRAERFGGVALEVIVAAETLPDAFAVFLRLEASGWKGDGGTGSAIATSTHLRAFYAALVERFGALGRCRVNLLRIADRYVAGQLCLRDGDRMTLLKIGYDEAFKDIAPGALLLDEVLRAAAADPTLSRLDLATAPDWARRWNPRYERLFDYWVFGGGARARLGRKALELGRVLKRKRRSSESDDPQDR